ncbi:MAG: hypothetical protein KGK34_10860 [Chloroflexota bacterium]|nr:hypothetical protein [Chloroflexota bacterium]
MTEDHGGARYAPGLPGDEEIHVPSPTIAPATVGLGVLLLAFGVAGISARAPETLRGASPVLLIVGLAILVVGLATWLINDAREFMRPDGHGGH